MFYVDSRLNVTRRDSSFLRSSEPVRGEHDRTSLAVIKLGSATAHLASIAEHSLPEKPGAKISVEQQLITSLFEAMLGAIVESWTVVDSKIHAPISPIISEMALLPRKVRKTTPKSGKPRSRTKLQSGMSSSQAVLSVKPLPSLWWNGQDEKVRVQFRNGNTYEGNISMKCMHGEGKFTWASGATYMGKFFSNELRGRGVLEWRNQTWYEGSFQGNMRHGYGIFVNSRDQLSYIGNWNCGTKDGQGIIYYSSNNLYDGTWEQNVRQGFGKREYSATSGYQGNWNNYNREGQGIMIWPNQDYYNGEWKDGVMAGHGLYVWNICANRTMSIPSQNAYNGYWKNGMRHGHGHLRLGFSNGSHYKGNFNENMKHGKGTLVTGEGFTMQSKQLFIDDNLASKPIENEGNCSTVDATSVEQAQFEMFNGTIDLWYHIDQALKGIDGYDKAQDQIVVKYITTHKKSGRTTSENNRQSHFINYNSESFEVKFEYQALQKAIRCYETDLKKIYYKYATVCNVTEIQFTPILLRLYMWQMYYDCKVHEKGLTLGEIDNMLYSNPAWLIQKIHDPFERIYYWQYLNSMIAVSSKLYLKKNLPSEKSDTMLASSFRKFMTDDILLHISITRGVSLAACMAYIPLNSMYKLYKSIGEPHTIRDFLMATRYPPHWTHLRQPALEVTPDEELVFGSNAFLIGDQIAFITEKSLYKKQEAKAPTNQDLKLFNLGILSSKDIIKNFAKIFPNVQVDKKIITLDIQLTFLEFYEVFFDCVKDSIAAKEQAERRNALLAEIPQNVKTDANLKKQWR